MSDEHFTIKIFCSYAQADELLSDELEKHLSVLSREGFVTIWNKRWIEAGTVWVKELDHHLNTASMILLLISADFVASDYCYGIEMKRAMARHQTGESCVIPISLRPVDWKKAPFACLQMLPSNSKSITTWSNQDEAFADVVAGIRKAMKDQSRILIIRHLIEDFISPSKSPSYAEEPHFQLMKILSVLKEGYEREGHVRWGLEQLAASEPLLNLMSSYLIDCGQPVQAELLLEQQLELEHPDTATNLNNLALFYTKQGKYEQAEPLFLRALAIYEQQPKPLLAKTATCLNNLAELYRERSQYEQAEPLFLRALAIREQQLESEHPDTANILNNLALLYTKQGEYEQAEPLHQRALAIWEQQEHPDTASGLNNLAMCYDKQGKYAEAKPLYQRALVTWEQQLGPQHPHTLVVRGNYDSLLRKME